MKTADKAAGNSAKPWDEEHVKSLLHFPRFPVHLIHQEPWHSWITLHGGLKTVYAYLQKYPLSPSHHRILEVVLSSPEEISDVYANRLNISRATYFYQLREFLPALVESLNHWDVQSTMEPEIAQEAIPPVLPTLPNPITKLIGAEDTLEELVGQFIQEEMRLLTLLGPGGIGKTRIGIEVAKRVSAQRNCPAFFVDLSPIHSAEVVVPAIAQAMGVQGIHEIPDLAVRVRAREMLLVLDNFEHLVPAAPLVTDLLAAAPLLKILITSRTALRIYGECEYHIPSLAAPESDAAKDIDRLLKSPAIALFVQRAKAVQPSFQLDRENAESICELCLRLEGIPLIIELAAYQVKFFSPQAMLVRLANTKRLAFFSHGPRRLHRRQQTPRDILSWSYDLLSPESQQWFREISIFSGDFSVEAAAAIHAILESNEHPAERHDSASPLAGKGEQDARHRTQMELNVLMDHSLLQQQSGVDGEPRFHLMEISREYGFEQLESRDEAPRAHRAHALFYIGFSESIMRSTDPSVRQSWVARFDGERSNLMSAIRWTVDQQEGELGLRFLAAIWNYWKFKGMVNESRQLALTILDQTKDQNTSLRSHVQRLLGWLAYDMRDYTSMTLAFQSCLEACEARDDRLGVGYARQGLGAFALLRGQWDLAVEHINESLEIFQETDDRRQMAWSIDILGRMELYRGNLDTARMHFQDSLSRFRMQNSKSASAAVLVHLGQTSYLYGELNHAFDQFTECVSLSRAMQDTHSPVLAVAENYLAEIAVRNHQPAQAREHLQHSFRICQSTGYTWCTELATHTDGLLAIEEQDLPSAAARFRDCILLQQSLKENWRSLLLLETISQLLCLQQDWLAAARLLGAVHLLRSTLGLLSFPIYHAQLDKLEQEVLLHLDPETRETSQRAVAKLPLDQIMLYALRCLE
jgi:predicted ATPase